MSSSQASSDDFPRLIGAENFDVWKTRVCAALDGKRLLGFVTKPDYDGVSEEESEDSERDMSDVDDSPKTKPAEEIDSDAVDYEDSDDELKHPSGSDEESGDSDTTTKTKKLPLIRPFNRSDTKRASKREARTKPKPLNPRERRRQEGKTKAFLMKTMDNTHVRLVKDLKTSYEIFQAICAKYEGAAFHGDPYFIQHYLMELKYEEGGDFDDFFLKLENAMNATSEVTESVMTEGQKSIYLFHALPKSWKDDLRVWKG
ncbi:Copia proteinlike [Phytophthora cinnamomi]|uniref:Copia proteinlike n=1 Tax=Phytophthora cinnamomi TaxID=4785 RepID=UPI0035593FF4|nr:Copia proteinlike [Phytophthora cinnamomi]